MNSTKILGKIDILVLDHQSIWSSKKLFCSVCTLFLISIFEVRFSIFGWRQFWTFYHLDIISGLIRRKTMKSYFFIILLLCMSTMIVAKPNEDKLPSFLTCFMKCKNTNLLCATKGLGMKKEPTRLHKLRSCNTAFDLCTSSCY